MTETKGRDVYSAKDKSSRFRAIFKNVFREREILLRSNDRVRYLRLSSRFQAFAAFAVSAFLLWNAAAGLGLWLQQETIKETRNGLLDSKLAYKDLLGEIAAYRRKVTEVTGKLKDNQADLLRRLAQIDNDAGFQSTSAQKGINRQADLSRNTLRGHLLQLDNELTEINNLNSMLEGSVNSIQADLAAVEAERAEVYQARTLLKERVNSLSEKLAGATDTATLHNKKIAELKNELASVRGELAKTMGERAQLSEQVAGHRSQSQSLVAQKSQLEQNVSSMKDAAAKAEEDYRRLALERAQLEVGVAALEGKLQAANDRGESLESDLRRVLAQISQSVGEVEPETPASWRDRTTTLLARLKSLHSAQSGIIENLALRTSGSIEDAERIIAMTGLKVSLVLKHVDTQKELGQGGPFIAALPGPPAADSFADTLMGLDSNLQRHQRLQAVLGSMPLVSPVDSYRIASAYGKRKDPFTGKLAMHHGADLGGRNKSAVRASAPGIVVSAGWNGSFGRMVEIDHGNGFKTRYGHLHQILVKKGQEVSHRQKIGLLGSSGRSTGPHVHYEIWFKDRTLNPTNFIKAGKYVFKK